MPEKYYIAIDTKEKRKPKLNWFKTSSGETYDVFYGKWEDIKSHLIGQKGIGPKSFQDKEKLANDFKHFNMEDQLKSLKLYKTSQVKPTLLYPAPSAPDNYDQDGNTELHIAIFNFNQDSSDNLRSLIKNKKELLNAENKQGYRPLAYAIKKRCMDAAEMLIEAGVDTEIIFDSGGKFFEQLDEDYCQAALELFPYVTDGKVALFFNEDPQGKYTTIKNVDIQDLSYRTNAVLANKEDYDRDDSRHRVANAWIKEQFKQNLIRRDYREVFEELKPFYTGCVDLKIPNKLKLCMLIHDWFYQLNNDNLFAGDWLANRAKGWLLSVLNNLKDDYGVYKKDNDYNFKIDDRYLEWFNNESPCVFKKYIKDGKIWIKDKIEYFELLQLAIIDDDDFLINSDNTDLMTNKPNCIAKLICQFGHRKKTYLAFTDPKIDSSSKKRKSDVIDDQSSPEHSSLKMIKGNDFDEQNTNASSVPHTFSGPA